MARCAPLVVLLGATSLAGCHFGAALLLIDGASARSPYRPETLAHKLGPGSVRTIGCLDVGLVPFQRDGDELVDLHVGNRCGYPEALDIRRAVITGYSETGELVSVGLADPRGELELFHLGGAEHAHERIRLDHAGTSRRLCFDLDRIDPDAPAARPLPLCFERAGGAWHPA